MEILFTCFDCREEKKTKFIKFLQMEICYCNVMMIILVLSVEVQGQFPIVVERYKNGTSKRSASGF